MLGAKQVPGAIFEYLHQKVRIKFSTRRLVVENCINIEKWTEHLLDRVASQAPSSVASEDR